MNTLTEYNETRSYRMIPTRAGRFLLMLDGYTFSRQNNTNNFYCSKKDSGCKTKVKLDRQGMIVKAPRPSDHSHQKPVYIVSRDGTMVKVNSETKRLAKLNVTDNFLGYKLNNPPSCL